MGSTGNPLNKKLLPVYPPLLAKKTAEDFMIPLIAFIEALVTIVKIHAGGWIQT
jgi:hypothetical protein